MSRRGMLFKNIQEDLEQTAQAMETAAIQKGRLLEEFDEIKEEGLELERKIDLQTQSLADANDLLKGYVAEIKEYKKEKMLKTSALSKLMLQGMECREKLAAKSKELSAKSQVVVELKGETEAVKLKIRQDMTGLMSSNLNITEQITAITKEIDATDYNIKRLTEGSESKTKIIEQAKKMIFEYE